MTRPQARMVVPTKFGGNPFSSLGEKRGQTNKQTNKQINFPRILV